MKRWLLISLLAIGAFAQAPDELDTAYNNLKAAQEKKDAAEVEKWAGATSALARQIVAKTTSDEDKSKADYARQVDKYTEYALYAMAMQTTDPAAIVKLVEALEKQNAQSEYLPQAYGRYLNALRQTGNADKAGAAAERAVARDPNNEEALLAAADYYLQKNNEPDKTVQYATRAADAMNAKAKPDAMSDADWQKKKQAVLGRAQWIQGVSYSNQGKYAQADKALRAALPLVQGDDQLTALGAFYLGMADYKLAAGAKNKVQLREALRFFEQSAAIKSAVQGQAQKNVKAIRGELGMK
jgi:tetratricopeptide (TPR) repeat protein